MSDLNAGLYASHAILAALLSLIRTGEGQFIDTSLFEAALAYTLWESNEYWATGTVPQRLGTAHRLAAPYQVFATASGWIAIGAANQRNWEHLARALDRAVVGAVPRVGDLRPVGVSHEAAEGVAAARARPVLGAVDADPVQHLLVADADAPVREGHPERRLLARQAVLLVVPGHVEHGRGGSGGRVRGSLHGDHGRSRGDGDPDRAAHGAGECVVGVRPRLHGEVRRRDRRRNVFAEAEVDRLRRVEVVEIVAGDRWRRSVHRFEARIARGALGA